MKQKVVIGMSGGVDSSVAALLLREQGYEVLGVTMQMYPEMSETVAEDASKVAKHLGIKHLVLPFYEEFRCKVMDYFAQEYLLGRTPNPCIACNRYVKWEALLREGQKLCADYIATGHYARIIKLPNGRFTVRNSVTATKDQTYALYALTQEQLAHTLMPVGSYTKEDIRKLAEEAGLPVAQKPDSQDICFVPDGDYASVLTKLVGDKMKGTGNFVTRDGEVLGTHRGIVHYTVGQRRGLDLPMGKRVFVTEIRPETNEVVVGEDADNMTLEVLCNNVNYMAIPDLQGPMEVFAKIRYNHKGEYCTIEKMENGNVICHFQKPVRAATPGQAVVFYDGEFVVGGGTIQ